MIQISAGALLAVSAGLASAQAMADCQDRLEELEEHRDQARYYPDEMRRDLRQLRDSAELLLETDREDLCNEVVDAMQETMEERNDEVQAAQKQARLENAAPVSEVTDVLRASSIQGSIVRSADGEELGTIEDVVVTPSSGEIAYVALSYGGFLGMGEKLIAVPWDALRLTEGSVFVLGVQQEALDKLEGFDEDEWPAEANEGWRAADTVR